MDVDDLFAEAGQFGQYQIRQYLLLSVPILFSSYQTVAYMFSTGNPIYRCRIPECEGLGFDTEFEQPWLSNTIPFNTEGLPQECVRYKPYVQMYNRTSQYCYPYNFDKTNKIRCSSWVFRYSENTAVSEFEITCAENEWRVALVGTINYLGFFIGLPVSGIFADRYGRRKVLAISCFTQSVVGVLHSFAPNYEIFLLLQFLGAFMSGAYNAGFVLGDLCSGLEIVGPNMRVLGNAIICCFHSVGEATVALLMWTLKDWRLLLRYLFVPGLFTIFYLWMIPESIRWLLTKGKIKETLEIFNKMAKVNKRKLPPNFNNNSLQISMKQCKIQNHLEDNDLTKTQPKMESPSISPGSRNIFLVEQQSSSSFSEIIHSSKLIMRLATCTVCWMVITMVFFGLSLKSTTVAGHKYLNFILTVLVELPGYMSTWLLMDVVKVGRRLSLALSFVLAGFTCISFIFISGNPWAKLLLFLLGKFSITFAFAVIYIFTAEMFPTEVRNSLLGVCSMAGHIGSMLAPQTTLLKEYIPPMLLWGVFSLIAGGLSLLFPETLNTKLPDTVAEAEKIGT